MSNSSKAIKYLKSNGVDAKIIGNSNLGNQEFIRSCGAYSEGIYAINSYLPEILGEKAVTFRNSSRKNFDIVPNKYAIHTYEAVKIIGEAIQEGKTRFAILDYLDDLKIKNKKVKAITGEFKFNKNGFSNKIPKIGKVLNGSFISADFQLIPIKNEELLQEEDSSSLEFNETELIKSTVVSTGMHIKEIENFDIFESRYSAKFIMWFNWNDAEIKEFDFVMDNGIITSKNVLERYVEPNTNSQFISYEVEADFEEEFLFYDYPFDEQVLSFKVKPKKKDLKGMIWVNALDRDMYVPEDFDIGVWQVNSHKNFIGTNYDLASMGNPKYKKQVFKSDFSVYNYNITVSRSVSEYLVKLVPLLIVIIVSYLSFFLDISRFAGSRLALAVTSFLSAVAFQMSQSGSLQNIGYITKSDYFYMITYALIFSVILETVVTNRLSEKGNKFLAQRIDNISGAVFPVIIFIGVYVLYS